METAKNHCHYHYPFAFLSMRDNDSERCRKEYVFGKVFIRIDIAIAYPLTLVKEIAQDE